ncbi:hypothetical protein J7T55_010653 [Diaporthe amygdali]|uniref:uncharacterized protein n=1 Tax=Phomopsis amygdali TaxID=1214568 RepID=UPI0022FEC475|nr:uncharacterized protein J7T55_010653 [Diaporthe amygdali]KAJ0114265.1 hypothetical protein J7T55_010653 [Diaporthe amygdali]
MAADPQPPASAAATTVMTQPNIYAEFLPRLGRISVVIHLPTPSTHKTKVLVARDALHLIVDHDGSSTKLRLPVKNRIAGEHLPGEVKPGLDKMSWRLLPTPEEAQAAQLIAADGVPWSAADLKPGLRIACRGCNEPIIPEETIKSFKDLPSENWAEMMEFWHCHKPAGGQANDAAAGAQEKASEDDLASRGYGANSIISAKNGVGFVDLMTILFSQDDCNCLLIPRYDAAHDSIVSQDYSGFRTLDAHCHKCKTQLGRVDNRKNGLALFKWKLNLVDQAEAGKSKPSSAPPSLSHCLAAALVATQARSGSAKVVLQGEKEAVTVWILNPHVKFSCSAKQGVYAMKLLFQHKAMDEEEILLPDQVVQEAKKILEQGNEYLPLDEKQRQFNPVDGPWMVSLLEQ